MDLFEDGYIYTNDTFEILDDLYRMFFKVLIYKNRTNVKDGVDLAVSFFSNNEYWYLDEGITNELRCCLNQIMKINKISEFRPLAVKSAQNELYDTTYYYITSHKR